MPPFSIDKPFYDQGTWLGRTMHFFTVTNPAYLFTSEKQIEVSVCRRRNSPVRKDCTRLHTSDAALVGIRDQWLRCCGIRWIHPSASLTISAALSAKYAGHTLFGSGGENSHEIPTDFLGEEERTYKKIQSITMWRPTRSLQR